MKTTNTPISKVYTVITYSVFGTIQTTVAYYTKEDAEKCVVDWANDNNLRNLTFETSEEAINWFIDNDQSVDISIRLEETYVYGNKTYYDEDMEMLASEIKLMGDFLSKLGYSQDEVSEIANTGMLEKPKLDEIITVVKLKNGILDEAKSFMSHKDAEAFFLQEVAKLEPSISEEDIGACLDNGYWDNNSGDDIFITQNDLVIDQDDQTWDIEPKYLARVDAEEKEPDRQTHQCCDNCGTHESQYIVTQCPKCGYVGLKATLSAIIHPKVGMQVCVGGYDNNASAGQQRFVNEHFGQLFEVLEVGEYSSKLKNVPFRVKHAHVFEIVKRGKGK